MGRFENGGQLHSGILNHPTLSGDVFSLSASLHWFDLFLAAVDVYTWSLEKKLLSPSEVFGELELLLTISPSVGLLVQERDIG